LKRKTEGTRTETTIRTNKTTINSSKDRGKDKDKKKQAGKTRKTIRSEKLKPRTISSFQTSKTTETASSAKRTRKSRGFDAEKSQEQSE
jgi:hypothetical protein